MYTITDYTKDKAKELNVNIYPSHNKKYKIDVYSKDNKFITSIGAIGYLDYPTYIQERGKAYADNRRRLYKIRHDRDRHIPDSRGFYADQLLW